MATGASDLDRRLYPRFVADRVREALADTPVVAVNGARQVGKSTLVTELIDRSPSTRIVTLDDETQLNAARADPATFVRQDGLLVIDEAQRAPVLLPAIKADVDRNRRPGRFLLTGSTRLLSTPEMSASLAGRVEIIDLWPLSQGELTGRRDRFVDALLAWDPSIFRDSAMHREDYMELVCAGGFPEPLGRSGRRRHAWFANYATTVVERMVADVADIDRLSTMPALLRLCAARTANELNVQDIARDLGLPPRTVSNYLTHLQTVFLIHLVPAWSRNLTSKVAHRPKLALVDSGLAAHLVRADAAALSDPTAPAGPLVETFVVNELRKQLGWSDNVADLYHFRDRGGAEVDIVIEAHDGRVAGVEVKASAVARQEDFRGLRLLESRLGDRFAGGVVLYTGPQAASFGARLAAVPLAALWEVGVAG
jgi:predicted AAA+ superfamily ATPase